MTEERQALLTQLGFRFGLNGPHAARTMMLEEYAVADGACPRRGYARRLCRGVVNDNVLGNQLRRHASWPYAI